MPLLSLAARTLLNLVTKVCAMFEKALAPPTYKKCYYKRRLRKQLINGTISIENGTGEIFRALTLERKL